MPSPAMVWEYFEPQRLGPVWRRDTWGNFVLPEYTIGYDVLAWIAANLVMKGKPWIPTPEQARFVLWFYATDEFGKRLHLKGVLQRLKGWGKDPLAAALLIAELIGPTYCEQPNEDALDVAICDFHTTGPKAGHPVGIQNPEAWVQLAAVSRDQNKNTRLMFPAIIPQRTIDKYRLDLQKEIIYVKGTGKVLEIIASTVGSTEGNRPTFVLVNEPHHWVPGKSGPERYETLYNNASKVGGAILMISNAYMPGQNSVLETVRRHVNQVRDGIAADTGWLYDSIEAHSATPMTSDWAISVLRVLRGDSIWVPIHEHAKNLLDTSKDIARNRRMFYNQIVSAKDSLYQEGDIDAIAVYGDGIDDQGARVPLKLKRGDTITLGFDGGKSDDGTALVAYRGSDRTAFLLGYWQKPEAQKEAWLVPRVEVNDVVALTFANFKVLAFFADVYPWESEVTNWGETYGDRLLVKASGSWSVGYDMRTNAKMTAMSHEAMIGGVINGTLRFDGHPLMRRHALNARVKMMTFREDGKETDLARSFRKDSQESPNKVDAYAAWLLAFMAWNKTAESGKKQKKQYRRKLHRSGG